jgi:hypothetical protein
LVCFGLLRNSSVCFGCFDIGSKHRNNPKFFIFGFTKQTETNAKQILFRFVSVRTEIYFCLFRGHPKPEPSRQWLEFSAITKSVKLQRVRPGWLSCLSSSLKYLLENMKFSRATKALFQGQAKIKVPVFCCPGWVPGGQLAH